jgi:hypothetical protein
MSHGVILDGPRIVFRYEARPMLVNEETKKGSYHARAAMRREWREQFWALAVMDNIGPQPPSGVTVRHYKAKGTLPDVAACLPSVKAAIDGLVDAGLWPNDTGEWVRSVTFEAPAHDRERGDAVELVLEPIAREAA